MCIMHFAIDHFVTSHARGLFFKKQQRQPQQPQQQHTTRIEVVTIDCLRNYFRLDDDDDDVVVVVVVVVVVLTVEAILTWRHTWCVAYICCLFCHREMNFFVSVLLSLEHLICENKWQSIPSACSANSVYCQRESLNVISRWVK